jgi:hypothetical protein
VGLASRAALARAAIGSRPAFVDADAPPLLPSGIVGLCSLFSIIFRLGFDLPLTTIINFDFSLFSITHWSFGFVLYLIRAVSDVVACIMIFAY